MYFCYYAGGKVKIATTTAGERQRAHLFNPDTGYVLTYYIPLALKRVLLFAIVSLLMLVSDFNSGNRRLLSVIIIRVGVMISR